jgi:hypothetical protein
MQKWEYLISSIGGDEDSRHVSNQGLNAVGDDGWELVFVNPLATEAQTSWWSSSDR